MLKLCMMYLLVLVLVVLVEKLVEMCVGMLFICSSSVIVLENCW